MAYCRVCLKVIKTTSKYEYYHDACVRTFLGSARYEPVIDIPSTQFQQEARQTQGKGMSISGVQAKLAASIVDGKIRLNSVTGDYIVKPCPELYPGLPANEHLSMMMARELGFKTAECALVPFSDGKLAFITKRYDRLPKGHKVHQEDMMQAMGLANREQRDKYNGSYEAVAKKIHEVTGNLIEPAEFLSRVMLMFLIGNGDFHLKNISLIYRDLKTVSLSPIYDAVNTSMYGDEHEFALRVLDNGQFPLGFLRHGVYGFEDFVELGELVGVTEKHLRVKSQQFRKNEQNLMDLINNSEMSDNQKAKYCETISVQLNRLTPVNVHLF